MAPRVPMTPWPGVTQNQWDDAVASMRAGLTIAAVGHRFVPYREATTMPPCWTGEITLAIQGSASKCRGCLKMCCANARYSTSRRSPCSWLAKAISSPQGKPGMRTRITTSPISMFPAPNPTRRRYTRTPLRHDASVTSSSTLATDEWLEDLASCSRSEDLERPGLERHDTSAQADHVEVPPGQSFY
jgi:hypothetical protein